MFKKMIDGIALTFSVNLDQDSNVVKQIKIEDQNGKFWISPTWQAALAEARSMASAIKGFRGRKAERVKAWAQKGHIQNVFQVRVCADEAPEFVKKLKLAEFSSKREAELFISHCTYGFSGADRAWSFLRADLQKEGRLTVESLYWNVNFYIVAVAK